MGLTLILVGITLISYNVFSEFIVTKIFRKRYNFHSLTRADVLCYVGEISLMFGIFYVFISSLQPYIKYNEPSIFKMFIDFFTVYQIGVLVILRLINASFIREYKTQLMYIEKFRYLASTRMSGEYVLRDVGHMLNGHLPYDIERRYKQIEEILHRYEKTIDKNNDAYLNNQDTIEYNTLLFGALDSMVIKVNAEIDILSNEWEASLFLRKVRLDVKRLQEARLAMEDSLRK